MERLNLRKRALEDNSSTHKHTALINELVLYVIKRSLSLPVYVECGIETTGPGDRQLRDKRENGRQLPIVSSPLGCCRGQDCYSHHSRAARTRRLLRPGQSSFDNLDAMTAVYAAVVTRHSLLGKNDRAKFLRAFLSERAASRRCQDVPPSWEFSPLATPLMKCLAQDTLCALLIGRVVISQLLQRQRLLSWRQLALENAIGTLQLVMQEAWNKMGINY